MKPIEVYHVAPKLPEKLAALRELAYNIYWCWHVEVIDLFRRVDRDLWEQTRHNPVKMLGLVKQQRLDQLAADEGFLAQLRRAHDGLTSYLSEQSYVGRGCREAGLSAAYFSAEFGLTECLPIYSGGLGMLAGDHLKSASDLNVPLVGVGLLYQQGYFKQFLNADGWQQEEYPANDFFTLPLSECLDEHGQPVEISVDYPAGPVHAKVWAVNVGRIKLYLLDTNIASNLRPEDRDITDQLYGGDNDTRLRQEIMLGIGGVRALRAVGIKPTVCHMNEGHAAFMALERIRVEMVEHGLSFAEAREATLCGNVFTTHTPVPAGHDRFTPEQIERYFKAYHPQLGLSLTQFIDLGRERDAQHGDMFSMTVLALGLASYANGVSELHGEVSREMFTSLWDKVPEGEIPISHVTNGVHARSWVSGDMAELYDRYLGPRWADDPMDRAVWERAVHIPDEELWRTHERRREKLVAFTRKRLGDQLRRVGATPREIRTSSEVLDPKVLTIGFARRFATYKRATLLLRDLGRLSRLLNDADRPVQILFSGKAHPRDNAGKELIRLIVHTAQQEEFRHRIVFLENYDQEAARYLVQGVDVWLNTPLRPLEASGTSGMKVVFNGGLNCSVPDGWWPEGYNGQNGWRIGRGESYDDLEYQNTVESSALYDLLERDIVPLYYDRGEQGLPRDWVARMKESIRTLAPVFNTNRMVLEYTRRFYMPSAQSYHKLNADELGPAKVLAGWKQKVQDAWKQVAVRSAVAEDDGERLVGTSKRVRATVSLGSLSADDVSVEIYHGDIDARGEFANGHACPMKYEGEQDGKQVFVGEFKLDTSGLQGFTVRVLPKHQDLVQPLQLNLTRWAGDRVPPAAG